MKFRFCWMVPALLASINAGAAPLSLAEAQRRAAQNAPPIAAQAAALDAARSMAVGAAELPDPKLFLALDNVPTDGADRFSIARDFMTMRRFGLMQDVVRGAKREARAGRAAAEVAREESMLTLARVNLDRDVALAWIERHFAEHQLALLQELAAEAGLQTSASIAQLAGAKGDPAESIAAQMAAAQLGDRIDDAKRMVARAVAGLRRWIGAAAEEPLAPPPVFERLSRDESMLKHNLRAHPHLAMYASIKAAADADRKLAEAARQPDWTLELAYAQRGSSYSNMVSIGFRMDLPIFQSKRQEPMALAKASEAAKVRAQTLDAERIHAAEIDMWLADWNSAKSRLDRYRGALREIARQRVDIALASYSGGKGELSAVLEARRASIDIRMAELMAEAELARAWAQLNFMLPQRKETP